MPASYTCSNCGHIMATPRGKCPNCGVNLILDGQSPSQAGDPLFTRAVGPPTQTGLVCPKCQTPAKTFAIVCEECGHWLGQGWQIAGMIFEGLAALTVFSFLVMILSDPANAKSASQITAFVGGIGLLFTAAFALSLRTYLKAKKTHDRLAK